MDYKFGNKNQWRRWLWNRISERITVPARDAIVLYLAGEAALDNMEACRRGFDERNMIAIEKNKKTVEALRKRGYQTIEGDILDVLNGWFDRPVNAVIGDFCSGLTLKLFSHLTIAPYNSPKFLASVWCLNFMRGRDSDMTEWRTKTVYAEPEEFRKYWPNDPLLSVKHRGAHFVIGMYCRLIDVPHGFTASEQVVLRERYGETWEDKLLLHRLNYVYQDMKPVLYSYRSNSNQTFDSCVFGPMKSAALTAKNELEEKRHHYATLRKKILNECPNIASIRQRGAALMAHRTRRFS